MAKSLSLAAASAAGLDIHEGEDLDDNARAQLLELIKVGSGENYLAALIEYLLDFKASITTFYIQEGRPMRIKSARGVLTPSELDPKLPASADEPMLREQIIGFIRQSPEFEGNDDTTVVERIKSFDRLSQTHLLGMKGKKRLRGEIYTFDAGRVGIALRVIPTTPMPLVGLGLPKEAYNVISKARRGLILITGPQDSGKSTTANAIINHFNETVSGHISMTESPIEFVHSPKKCVVSQKEVGVDVPTFAYGLERSLRQSTDLMFVGEAPDRDTAAALITGGETGALMLGTTHSNTTVSAVSKILALVADEAEVRRPVVASSLVAVICQALVPAKTGDAYHMVCDVLMPTEKVRSEIEAGNWHGLANAIKNLSPDEREVYGFHSMNTELTRLVEGGLITAENAINYSSNPKALREAKLHELEPR
jgi:twitching motility protein PilT